MSAELQDPWQHARAALARRAELGYRLGEPTADAVREALGEDACTAASCEGAALTAQG